MKRIAGILVLVLLVCLPGVALAMDRRDAGGSMPSFDYSYRPVRNAPPAPASEPWYTARDAAKSTAGWAIGATLSAAVAQVKQNAKAFIDNVVRVFVVAAEPVLVPILGSE